MTSKLASLAARSTLALALLSLSTVSTARETLLLDQLPGALELRDVSASVNDVLARHRWRILPGSSERIFAQHQDARTICRVAIQLRAANLFLDDDCRKPGVAGNWVDSAERRAIPEAWLRPLRRDLRLRYPRPTPTPG